MKPITKSVVTEDWLRQEDWWQNYKQQNKQ